MNGEYIRDDSREFCSIEEPVTADSRSRQVGLGVGLTWKVRLKRRLCISLQVLHFLISMGYLWAGVVEFIRNPPFFDAYGDATESIDLPPGLFKNDPRSTESGILRLMDLPILIILIMYQGVCLWLRYKGLSWLLTASISVTFLFFWIVNFWGKKLFDWKHYSTRMNGLELQVSSIALSGTIIFMVIFFKRQKFPFKFKSSLNSKHNSSLYILWNFLAIYLVMFSSLMIWFIKLYASWACFSSVKDIMQLCSTTEQVQCYPCSLCSSAALRKCVKTDKELFSCSSRFPSTVDKGAFCTFNFNMSVYGFLLTFAYIGGLCVFLSTFLRIVGHYVFRGFFLACDIIKRLHYGSSDARRRFRQASSWKRYDREMENPCNSNSNNNIEDSVVYSTDSDEEGNVLITVAFG